MGKKQLLQSFSFVGKYEVSVLSDYRIILPINVLRQFNIYRIKRILLSRLPGLKALVLCPEGLWEHWVNMQKKSFPCLETHNGARTFLVPWQPIHWDTKGRITLPRQAKKLIGINASDTVLIIGNKYCFELWHEKEFNKIALECEDSLVD